MTLVDESGAELTGDVRLEVRLLRVRPGDRIVLRSLDALSLDQLKHISKHAKDVFGDEVEVVILNRMEIDVVRRS